jgi:hypothetical protein
MATFVGKLLTLTDTSSKSISGYVGRVGTGLAYGAGELLNNPSFDVNTAGWSVGGAGTALASVAGGQVNNCLRVTEGGTANPYASQSVAGNFNGACVYFNVYVKQGTSSVYHAYLTTSGSRGWQADTNSTSGWVQVASYIGFCPATWSSAVVAVLMNVATAASGKTHFFDEVSLKKVTEPSSSGAIIQVAPGVGQTQSWLSEDVGFNRNDSTYVYKLYDPGNAGDLMLVHAGG